MTEDSFSAPATAPSINKIPFLVFDAILVITAVALAFSAQGPLSPVLFFWILLCVVVGGVVGCLPFWIEFRDKVRLSEYEIRERQSSAHDSQWQYVDARLVEQNEFLQKLHLRLSDSADRLASLEARPPTPTADELALLCGNALQKQWPDWREELLSVLSRRTDVLFNEQNAQTAKFSAAHEKRLAELRGEFTAVESVLRGLETRVGQIALLSAAAGTAIATQTVRAAAQQPSAPAEVAADEETFAANVAVTEAPATDATDAADNAATEYRADATPETDTQPVTDSTEAQPATEAQRAAEAEAFTETEADETGAEVQDSDEISAEAEADDTEPATDDDANETGDEADETGEADDETGETEAFATTGETAADAKPATDAVAAEETFIEAIATAEAAVSEAPKAETDANTDLEAAEQTQAEPEQPTDSADAPAAPVATSAPEQPAAEPKSPATISTPEQPVLLETPAAVPPTAPQRGGKSAADKTTLVAQVLIGIGNKPYVRGVGPGLSMEKGVPMQFVEIGKWEWVCPSGTVPVKIQIYKNDEIPSSLGEIELEPGQRKAVTPTFRG